jgi:hypothetical protein
MFDFFKKKKKDEVPQLEDLVLSKLRPGYLVERDLKVYTVTSQNRYEWEEGGVTDEWELQQGEEVWFLERVEDDGYAEWSLCQKLSIDEIEGDIAQHIIENEDPPEKVVCRGTTYHFECDDIGRFYRGNATEEMHFVVWDFEDEAGKNYLTIEQWGESKFDITLGFPVEEYQFTNILPGPA